MYLYTRRVTVGGDPREVMPVAAGMAQLVTEKTGLQMSLWVALLGAPVGTMSYTTFVQSHAELDAAMSVLNGDDEFLDRLAGAQKFVVGAPEDQLVEILHSSGGEYRRAEVGWVASITTAHVANARFGAALKWSVEMSDLVAEITGLPGMLGRSVSGAFGQVGWISTMPDMATLDSTNEALGKDARYLAKLDEMADVFIQGSGHATLSRRLV